MKKLVLLTLIVATGLIYYIKTDIESISGNIAKLSSLPTAEIVRGTISSVISGRGKITPNRLVPVNSFVDGQISEILVKKGEEVKKGQCLVKINVGPELKFRLLDLKQKVIANDYRKKQLNEKVDLQNRLYKDGLSSRNETEELNKNLKWAEIEEQALNSERQLLEKRFGFTLTMSNLLNDELSKVSRSCISSVINGTVLQIDKRVDDVVFGEGDFNRNTIMFIADVARYFIDYKANELDLYKIHPGQQVDITFDSLPEKLFHGEIVTISSIAVFDMQSGFVDPSREMSHYRVKIQVTDVTPELRPGLSCRISIKTATNPDVILAPVTSIFTEENGQQFVFVLENEAYKLRQVQVGMADVNMVEIQTGLVEGEVVSLEPLKIIEHEKIIRAAESRTLIEKILH